MLTVHNCEEWLIHQTAEITFTDNSTGWKNGLTGISQYSTRASAISYTRRNNTINSLMLGSTQLESSFAEKVLPYQIVHESAAMFPCGKAGESWAASDKVLQQV